MRREGRWDATQGGHSAPGVRVIPVPTRFADDTDIWPNFRRLLRLIVQLVNGDYFFRAQLNAHSTLSFACAAVILVALAAPFALIRRELHSGTWSAPTVVYATFWAACITLNCASFVLSSEGTHPGVCLIPVLYAVAATGPIVLSGSPLLRIVGSIGVAIIATASLVNVAENRPQVSGGGLAHLPPIASVANRIVEISRKEHARRGYAGYWDASSLTWSSHMAVHVRAVVECTTSKLRALCPYPFNVSSSWYQPSGTRWFLLEDASSKRSRRGPPPTLGRPIARYELGDGFTMYVYPYDVASRLDYRDAPW